MKTALKLQVVTSNTLEIDQFLKKATEVATDLIFIWPRGRAFRYPEAPAHEITSIKKNEKAFFEIKCEVLIRETKRDEGLLTKSLVTLKQTFNALTGHKINPPEDVKQNPPRNKSEKPRNRVLNRLSLGHKPRGIPNRNIPSPIRNLIG